MTRIVFLDTETTSLRHDRRAWEVGLITRSEDGTLDKEHQWFIDLRDLDLGNADLFSLNIGRFHERHPQVGGIAKTNGVMREDEAMRRIEQLTRGAHLVGAVPNFDAEVLGARMREHGICPSWHYHLCCVENLAVGYLAARGEPVAPPWSSDDLSTKIGVSVESDDRHTALGDARWAMRIYDAVTGHG